MILSPVCILIRYSRFIILSLSVTGYETKSSKGSKSAKGKGYDGKGGDGNYPPVPEPTPYPTKLCGNGHLDRYEECDPYYTSENGYGCYRYDYFPWASQQGKLQCNEYCQCVGCGNGIREGYEECEPKPGTGGEKWVDGYCGDRQICNNHCMCEAKPTKAPTAAPTAKPTEMCGNGYLNKHEECDPAIPKGAGGCNYTFPLKPSLTCEDNCKCKGCGNGRIDDGEECEVKKRGGGFVDGSKCNPKKYDCIDCKCRAKPTPAPTKRPTRKPTVMSTPRPVEPTKGPSDRPTSRQTPEPTKCPDPEVPETCIPSGEC